MPARDEKRPTVQVGDPFTEKLLLEACLELMGTDAIVAIQDMGAAGLTSSSVEMAGKGGMGIELDLDRVPMRETGMTPYELMLSESQERMLMVLKPDARDRRPRHLRKVGAGLRRDWPPHQYGPSGARKRAERSWRTYRLAHSLTKHRSMIVRAAIHLRPALSNPPELPPLKRCQSRLAQAACFARPLQPPRWIWDSMTTRCGADTVQTSRRRCRRCPRLPWYAQGAGP